MSVLVFWKFSEMQSCCDIHIWSRLTVRTRVNVSSGVLRLSDIHSCCDIPIWSRLTVRTRVKVRGQVNVRARVYVIRLKVRRRVKVRTRVNVIQTKCQNTRVWAWISWVATISRLLKLYVSFAKESYKRDYILQKRPRILRSLLIVATPYRIEYTCGLSVWRCEIGREHLGEREYGKMSWHTLSRESLSLSPYSLSLAILERWGAGVEYHFQEISWNLRPVVNGT